MLGPHPKNAPGPFYVEYGCCTACDVPFAEAPELFSYDSENHCFVRRQPTTKDEANRMFRAAFFAELRCIRYRGDDPATIQRLAEAGLADLCDSAPVSSVKEVYRNHATFDSVESGLSDPTAVGVAKMFMDFLRGCDWHLQLVYKFSEIRGDRATASFRYAWHRDNYHTVEFVFLGLRERGWLVRIHAAEEPSGRSVARDVDDWLKTSDTFRSIRWYSPQEWASRELGKEWPF